MPGIPPIAIPSSGCVNTVAGSIMMLVAGSLAIAIPMPFGLIPGTVALIGLGIATWRSRRTYRPSDGMLETASSVFGFSWSGDRRVGPLQRMRISPPTVVGSGKNKRTVFHLDAQCELGEFRIDSPTDPLAARREGERWARHCAVPLADCSSGSESVRAPDQLDQSAAQRVEAADLAAPRPAQMRCLISEEIGAIVITQPFSIARAAALGGGLLFASIIAAVVLFNVLPTPIALGIVAALLLSEVVAFGVLVKAGVLRQRLRIEPGVRIAVDGRDIPAAELEEVVIGQNPSRLRLVSDRRLLDFGQGLDEAELAHLRALVLGAMRARG
jgi:hypothetical protein